MSTTGKVVIHSGIGLASAIIGFIIGAYIGFLSVLLRIG